MKKCKHCDKTLILGENWLESRKKYNTYVCNSCAKIIRKLNYTKNKEKELAKQAEYRNNNVEIEKLRHKKYRDENKEILLKKTAEYREINRDELRNRHKIWRENNKDKIKEYGKNDYEKRKEQYNKYSLKYHKENKEHLAEKSKEWKFNNFGKVRAMDAKRRAAKLERTLKDYDIDNVKKVYEKCPKNLTVDHILPLQGEYISGLHVGWNLQYLTLSENSSKGIKFDGSYENEGWRVKCKS